MKHFVNRRDFIKTMVDMHANVLQIATSGNTGWYIPGTQFAVASDLGDRYTG